MSNITNVRLTLTKPDNAPIVLSSDVDFISAQNSDQNVYMNITRPEGYTGYSLSLYLRPGTDHTPTEFALNMGNLFVLPKRFLTYLRIFISVGFKNSDGSLVTNSNEIFFKVFPSNAGMVSASPIDDLAFVKVEVADGNINFYNVYGDLMDSAPISAGALPAGGTVGQVLTKVGSADYEVDWADTSDASDSVVYDNNDDIRPRSNIIMSAGKQIYGLDAAGITHPLLATNTYDVGLPSERIQNEFGSKGYHASIQSDDRPTVDTASGQESVAYVSDIDGKNAKYETAIGEPSVSTDPVPLTSTNVSDALDELTERGQININSIAAANSKISDLQDAIDGISANQLTGAEFTRVINGTTDLAANLFSTFSLVADKTFFYDVNGTLAVYRKTENNLASFTTMTIASLGDDEPTLLGNVNGEDSTALPQTTSAAQTVFGRSVSIDDYAKLIKSNGTVMEYYITSIDTTSGNITWGNEITINTSDYQAQTTAGDSGKVLTGGATAGRFGTSLEIESIPTENSTNLVSSGGVFSANSAKKDRANFSLVSFNLGDLYSLIFTGVYIKEGESANFYYGSATPSAPSTDNGIGTMFVQAGVVYLHTITSTNKVYEAIATPVENSAAAPTWSITSEHNPAVMTNHTIQAGDWATSGDYLLYTIPKPETVELKDSVTPFVAFDMATIKNISSAGIIASAQYDTTTGVLTLIITKIPTFSMTLTVTWGSVYQ